MVRAGEAFTTVLAPGYCIELFCMYLEYKMYCIADMIVLLYCILAAMFPPVPPLSRVDAEVSMQLIRSGKFSRTAF